MNKWIEYYGKQKISPVRQDISDMEKHLAKREKLYRQLGIPSIFFEGKRVLEVGPGSGYNTLAFFEWGSSHVMLVEPNQVGRDDMLHLFSDLNIDCSRYDLIETAIEDVTCKEAYDIIIAEGFIHACDNAKEIIGILESCVRPGGVIVITCMDYEGMFVEQMQRLVFQREVHEMKAYDDKVAHIAKLITKYDKLEGRSRSIEDWIRDDILNPTFNNKEILSFDKAIDAFSDNFAYLGGSQSIFEDYSWYKDLAYDERTNIKYQNRMKRHNFLMTGLAQRLLTEADVDLLYGAICKIRALAVKYEEQYEDGCIEKIIEILKDAMPLFEKIDSSIKMFVESTICVLSNGFNSDFDKQVFLSATGRTQQYLAMMRRRYC